LPFFSRRRRLIDGGQQLENLFVKLFIAGKDCLSRVRINAESASQRNIVPGRGEYVLERCFDGKAMSAGLPQCLFEFFGGCPCEDERYGTGKGIGLGVRSGTLKLRRLNLRQLRQLLGLRKECCGSPDCTEERQDEGQCPFLRGHRHDGKI